MTPQGAQDVGKQDAGRDSFDGSFDPKWLPGSPHREAILKFIAQGRAHVQQRGHGLAPLLVFEDGGAIELPLVRYQRTERGMELVAAERPDTPDQTKYRDVCGSIDAIKARLRDDPAGACRQKQELLALIDDVVHMLGRLRRRREAYEAFAGELRRVCEAMERQPRPDTGPGLAGVEELRRGLASATPEELLARRERLFSAAEAARALAQQEEDALSAWKELAICVGRLYRRIRGARQWDDSP